MRGRAALQARAAAARDRRPRRHLADAGLAHPCRQRREAARGRRNAGRSDCLGRGRRELEPDAGAVVAAHAPASGDPLDKIQSIAAWLAIGTVSEHRAVTLIVDLDPDDAVGGVGPHMHRRAGRLRSMPDAVGDELGDEQARVIVKLSVRAAAKPARDDRAGGGRRLRPARDRRCAEPTQAPLLVWWHRVLLGTPARPSPNTDRLTGTPGYGGTGPALLDSCEAGRAASKLRLRDRLESTRSDERSVPATRVDRARDGPGTTLVLRYRFGVLDLPPPCSRPRSEGDGRRFPCTEPRTPRKATGCRRSRTPWFGFTRNSSDAARPTRDPTSPAPTRWSARSRTRCCRPSARWSRWASTTAYANRGCSSKSPRRSSSSAPWRNSSRARSGRSPAPSTPAPASSLRSSASNPTTRGATAQRRRSRSTLDRGHLQWRSGGPSASSRLAREAAPVRRRGYAGGEGKRSGDADELEHAVNRGRRRDDRVF